MFGTVRLGIFAQQGKLPLEAVCKFCINGYCTERSFPRAFAHDGERHAAAGVVGAENQAAPWNLEARGDRSGDVARIHVAGMRDYAAKGASFRYSPREIRTDVGPKPL